MKLGLGLGFNRGNGMLPPTLFGMPAAFRWQPSFNIYENGRTYSTDFDPSTVKPAGTTKFVATTGNDTTGDGSIANPYLTITKALAVGATVINLRAGVYGRSYFSASLNPSANCTIIAYDGISTVILGRFYQNQTWVQEASPNQNVYAVTQADVLGVVDLIAPNSSSDYYSNGTTKAPVGFTKVASIAACQALPSSFYYDGVKLYVNTYNNRMPDNNILGILINESVISVTNKINFYMEGIVAYGRHGLRFDLTGSNTSTVCAYKSDFRIAGSSASNIYLRNIDYGYLLDCKIGKDTDSDAISILQNDATAPTSKILIKDGDVRNAGGTGVDSNDNCIQISGNLSVIMVNGYFEKADGPVVLARDSAMGLCLGTSVKDSSAQVTTQQFGFSAQTAGVAGNSVLYLKNCQTLGGVLYDRGLLTGGEIRELGGFIKTGYQNYNNKLNIINNSVNLISLMGQSLAAAMTQQEWSNALSPPLQKECITINQAVSGSGVMQEEGGIFFWWTENNGTTLSPLASTAIANTLTRVTDSGVLATDLKIIHWIQGHSSTLALYQGTVTKTQWINANKFLFGQFKATFPNVTILLSPFTRDGGTATPELARLLVEAQLQLINDVSYVMKGVEAYDVPVSTTDHLHPTSAGRQTFIDRLAKRTLFALGNIAQTGTIGPSVTSATGSGTTITATITHDAGNDLVFKNGDPKLCFTVEDSVGFIGVNAVTKINETTLSISLARSLGGSGRVLHIADNALNGLDDTNPQVVVDNAVMALPLNKGKIVIG